jgi:hypothetical protein
MAPEQALGRPLDHRADLFSLGSVLYALCTGRPPFRAPTTLAVLRRVSEDTPHPIRDLNPAIPEWLVAIIDTLHAKNPADRFQSADELARLLAQYLRHLRHPTAVRVPRRVARRARAQVAKPRRRLPLILAALVLLGLLAAIGGWFAFGGRVPGTVGPEVALSNGSIARRGALCSIQVEYRLVQGQLPAGSRCVWVVQSPGGTILEQELAPATFGAEGTLEASQFIPAPVLFGGPALETYLAIESSGPFHRQRRRISNTVSLTWKGHLFPR